MEQEWLLPDRPEDDLNCRRLKHAYRWGVVHGAIDPASDKGLWESLDQGRKPERLK